MNLKQQVREAEMKLRRCEAEAKSRNEQERCLRQYKIDVLKIKEEKQAQPMFKDTDKILVHRDGVDYQADIGPLMGGGEDSTCVEVVSATPSAYDNFIHRINPGVDMNGDRMDYILSVGYHPDFGWRGICSDAYGYDKFWAIKPGTDLRKWEAISEFPIGVQNNNMGQMVPIGDKLVSILSGTNKEFYRFEISESSITNEKIFDSLEWPEFTYSNYDSELGTWFIRGGKGKAAGESWEYNENTKVATQLNDNILNRTSVDGKVISVTTTGLEFQDGSTVQLWDPADVVDGDPNNASITYSPELNQIAVVVSLADGYASGYPDDLFNHARNLWVSDDKGVTWREIDTEPDPEWAGEIVQWSGIDWIPNAPNGKGTKGHWIALSLRGGGPFYADGHLHTLTSDDGVTWRFDYGYRFKTVFDGKYTVFGDGNYVITGLGKESDEHLAPTAWWSKTATVRVPGTAVVESTEGLEPGMYIQSGDERVEIIEVIDGTTFLYAGEITAGEVYCPTTTVHWDDIVGKPPKPPIKWNDIVDKPCIPECPKPSCKVEIEYLGKVFPHDFGEVIQEYNQSTRDSVQWHTYRLKDFSQGVLFEKLHGEVAWGDSLEFTDGFDAAGIVQETDGTKFYWFQTYGDGPMNSSDSVTRTDTNLCSSENLREIIEDLTARVTALEAASP